MRGAAGPPLLVTFGLGIGLALSVFIKGLPVAGTLAAGEDVQGPARRVARTVTVAKTITAQPLTSGSGAANKSFSTASITPEKDKLVLAAVANAVSGKDAHPTLAGAGLTWTEIASSAKGSRRISVFRALPDSPKPGAVTVTYPESQSAAAWSLTQFSGIDTGGNNGSAAIEQSVTDGGTASKDLKLSLDKLKGKNDVSYGAFADTATGKATIGDGFTTIHDVSGTAIHAVTEWSSSGATDVAASAPSNVDWTGIGVALKAGVTKVTRYLTIGGSTGSNGYTSGGSTIAGHGGTQAVAGSGGTSSGAGGSSGGGSGGGGSGDGGSGGGGDGGGSGGGDGSVPGVTDTTIKVAANIVTDGPDASFLKDAINGIRAVINQANVNGVNGRKILLTYRNDSFDASTGLQYIQNYIAEKYFALAVNPSSEGLNLAVQNGTIDNAGMPVVGSDGMLISQYRWPANSNSPGAAKWVWPVAASTVSTMHIIVDYAKSHGAQTFGLVYDKKYRFGVEGAEAFQSQLSADGVSSGNVHVLGIEPGQTSYSTDVSTFNASNFCGNDDTKKCDVVAMLLDPSTAKTWISSGGTFGAKFTMGTQTLFNTGFGDQCTQARNVLGNGRTCNGFIVWTGYNPPVGALANNPDVAKYVDDVHSVNGQADVNNSFTEGAYLGAKVFVKALQQAGRDLTRAKLQAVMDSLSYSSGLSNTLQWSPNSHFANTSMHAFRVNATNAGHFAGWGDVQTGWVKDTRVGQY